MRRVAILSETVAKRNRKDLSAQKCLRESGV